MATWGRSISMRLMKDRREDLCSTILPLLRSSPRSWTWARITDGATDKHLTADQVWEKLHEAVGNGLNLLLNTAPLRDGSMDPDDDLRHVAGRIRRERWPA